MIASIGIPNPVIVGSNGIGFSSSSASIVPSGTNGITINNGLLAGGNVTVNVQSGGTFFVANGGANIAGNLTVGSVYFLGNNNVTGAIVNGTNCTGTYVGNHNDQRGSVRIVVSAATVADAPLVTIPFSAALAAQPAMQVSGFVDATATALLPGPYYVDVTSLSQFVIKCHQSLAAGTYGVAWAIPFE